MKRFVWVRLAGATAALVALASMSSPAAAIDSCKVKVSKKTGVIEFSANIVPGAVVRWGSSAGTETAPFFDPACDTGDKLKKCTLADPLTLNAKRPPSDCTLYVADHNDATSCSVWIPGCTPAARGRGVVGYVWADQPSSTLPYAPHSSWSYNSSAGTNMIARSSAGVYTVTLPGVPSEGVPHNNVQVTAYGSSAIHCTVASWSFGSDPSVIVRCFNTAGIPTDARFSMLIVE